MESEIWYFHNSNGIAGPVSRKVLNDLIRTLSIFPYTPVWRNGLTEWIRFADSLSAQIEEGSSESEKPPPCEVGTCSFSGELHFLSELLPYGNQLIAPEYKDRFVQSSFEMAESTRDHLVVDLSPITCLKQSWQIFKSNAVFLFAVMLVVYLPLEFFFRWWEHSLQGEGSLLLVFAETVLNLFSTSITGAIVLMVASASFRGESLERGDVMAGAFKKFIPVVVINFFLLIGSLVGFVLLIIPGLYFVFRCAFAVPLAFAEEPEYGMDAISGSWQMVAGRQKELFWFLVVFLGVFVFPLFVIVFVFAFIFPDFWPLDVLLGVAMSAVFSLSWIYWYLAFEHFENA